jgi:dinuclear metal center YbgI/SA1388 family protein
MKLSDLTCVLEDLAPLRYAESWDNVGLIVGDPKQPASKAILTIDYTTAVAREAQSAGCDVVVAYHPPIFDGLKRIVGPSAIHDAVRRGVAIYSPHTALDVAPGGTNDVLCEAMGLTDARPLRVTSDTKAGHCKLVVFAPQDAAEKVSAAMFDAGAGRIGNYTRCSFLIPGTGTFFGEAGTNPAVGERGKLQRVEEIRIETIVPLLKVGAVVAAMRKAHPYEEPAFDLNQLAAPPEGLGQGRVGEFKEPVDRAELVERIKRGMSIGHVLVAGPTAGSATKVACLAGAGGEHLKDALAERADVYVTGEVRHHDALRAAERGVTVICTLHSNSERAVLPRFKQRIEEKLPGFPVIISEADRDPFEVR